MEEKYKELECQCEGRHNWDKIGEAISKYCYLIKMHEVCYFCSKICKQKFTHWSGQMPPLEYCDKYED